MTDQEKKEREDLRAYRREELRRIAQRVIADREKRLNNKGGDK